jgi:hypothetical protein
LGVLHGSGLAVHSISRALAVAKNTHLAHATKQVDRLLSNEKVALDVIETFEQVLCKQGFFCEFFGIP